MIIRNCPNCGWKLTEINNVKPKNGKVWKLYPKLICEPNVSKNYHEYRYFCKNCSVEWIYDTLRKIWDEVDNPGLPYNEEIGMLEDNE